ncbi:Eco47II family restriction endonuclease [Candidatus Sulfurimonas baltica]|uniref:Eco47II family restriction endonuclease n=1 Tax=Candidatus Sulfurimonas baltica TaxID=2740404 RepID=A0A7S7LW09_9BACT|nr:Eco47II family restriction endonuclease [Candidatus Sulfurimonas baltica]QOY52493.1 Eco47II family restriction endonuclease [Candidatus Sulfurimonas baltica]
MGGQFGAFFAAYTGYYVEIIPKKPKQFNVLFTPPDNTTGSNRPYREDIRKIDGKSFYELLTNDKNAIYDMYEKISNLLAKNLKMQSSEQFIDLLNRAYGQKK